MGEEVTVEIVPRKRGGQRKNPPKNAAALITEGIKAGSTKKGIAYTLGCTLTVFNRWLEERPDLQDAFDQGLERERIALHTRAVELAMAGDQKMIAFLLKARHGYREDVESDQANRVAITFNLPGAMTSEQFEKLTIENDARPQ